MTPTERIDALIEHLVDAERRLTVAFAKAGVDSSVLNDMRLLSNAAVALRGLRDENARLKDRLEAQFKRLTSMDGLLANADARIAALAIKEQK
jgi:hypothetical protein